MKRCNTTDCGMNKGGTCFAGECIKVIHTEPVAPQPKLEPKEIFKDLIVIDEDEVKKIIEDTDGRKWARTNVVMYGELRDLYSKLIPPEKENTDED